MLHQCIKGNLSSVSCILKKELSASIIQHQTAPRVAPRGLSLWDQWPDVRLFVSKIWLSTTCHETPPTFTRLCPV